MKTIKTQKSTQLQLHYNSAIRLHSKTQKLAKPSNTTQKLRLANSALQLRNKNDSVGLGESKTQNIKNNPNSAKHTKL